MTATASTPVAVVTAAVAQAALALLAVEEPIENPICVNTEQAKYNI